MADHLNHADKDPQPLQAPDAAPEEQSLGPVTAAIQGVLQGKPNADKDLHEAIQTFWQRMLGYVRRHRPFDLQAVIETEGIVNAAFYKVVNAITSGKYPGLRDHQALERFMTTVTKRTMLDIFDATDPSPPPFEGDLPDPHETESLEEFLEDFLPAVRGVHDEAINI